MKKKIWLIILAVVFIAGSGVYKMIENNKSNYDGLTVEITGTDKSMYSPKDIVKINFKIGNTTEKEKKNIPVIIRVMHLGEAVAEFPVSTISLASGESKEAEYQWVAPDNDFTGYLLEIGVADKNGTFAVSDTIGVDVSSTWVKFPRYGYLCVYDKDTDTKTMIEQMTRYHINGIEYYDWHYLHHQPLADGVTEENPGSWKDWSGREISGQTIVNYINEAKERNMASMAYDMIYAGTDTFFKDKDGNPTKANEWKIYFAEDNERGEGNFTFHMGTSPSGNDNLYFLNPLNKEWQEHIFSEMLKVFKVFDFDGWHGDTVGDWGKMVTADKEPLGYKPDGTPIYLVKDTYTQFLNAAKEALGDKYLSFNPVGAQGIENVNISNVDVLYAEFWPWDSDREGRTYDTYESIVREIERSNKESEERSIDGKGKSLVVKAYINYYKTNGYMNEPGVLLMDAAAYAAGGSRLELGNGNHMLHKEYYPDDNILMDEELQNKMKDMADFIVAYENILRDGQRTTDNMVDIEGFAHSSDGISNTIWTYTRADAQYEILHLVNLLGTDNQWRDERGKKEAPTEVSDIKVKYYTDKKISNVFIASPDINDCKSERLDFEEGEDGNGTYIQFTVSGLKYWDMIYMK